MSFAEVTVRFAGTLLEVTHVRLGDQYRIGTAPGVELPLELAGITSFPIIDASSGAFVVRRPVGTYATRNALAMEEPDARLAPTDHFELWLGNVLVTIELVATPAPLAMSRVDRRPAGYLAGSLVAHLAIWAAAIVLAAPIVPVPKPPRPRLVVRPPPMRLVRIQPRPEQQPPPPTTTRVAKANAKPGVKANAKRHVARPATPSGPPDMFEQALAEIEKNPTNGPAILGALITKMDVPGQLAKTDPYYDPQAEHEGDFAHDQFKFDPDTRPGFDTIKIDHYNTISTGAAAGEHYSIQEEHARVHVRLCEDDGCTADGALQRDAIDYRLAYKLRQFASCYHKDAETVTFQLVIGADGKVREAHGPGRAGECVAKVASAVTFPTAADETRVSYSVLFVPPFVPQRVPG